MKYTRLKPHNPGSTNVTPQQNKTTEVLFGEKAISRKLNFHEERLKNGDDKVSLEL